MAIPIPFPRHKRLYRFARNRWLSILLTPIAFAAICLAFREPPSPGKAAVTLGAFVAVITFFKINHYQRTLTIAICACLVWIEICSISKQDKEHVTEIKQTQTEITAVLNNVIGKDSYPIIEPSLVAILSTDATSIYKFRFMPALRNVGPNQLSGVTYRIYSPENSDVKSDIPVFIAPRHTQIISKFIDIKTSPTSPYESINVFLTANNGNYDEQFYLRIDPTDKNKVQWRYDINASWHHGNSISQDWKRVEGSKRQISKSESDDDSPAP